MAVMNNIRCKLLARAFAVVKNERNYVDNYVKAA
jgi:hypothetical protein